MKSCFLSTARVGLKGPTGTFFSIFLGKQIVFLNLYILVKNKCHKKKKKISDRPTGRFLAGGQETIIHLMVAWC